MRSHTSLKLASLAFAAAALASAPAQAASFTGTMAVTSLVLSTCLVAPAPLLFSDYSLGAIVNEAVITVTCTSTDPYTVGLNAGSTSGGTTTDRKMTFNSNTLNYKLFSNALRTTNWGNTAGETVASGAATTTLTGGLIKTFTVYGQIPSGQSVPPGLYTDTVTVTVTY